MTFRERLLQRDHKVSEKYGPMKPWHSLAYHQHFAGYEERYVTDEKGKRHIVRTYTAESFYLDLPGTRAVCLSILRLILCLLALFLGIYVGSMRERCNSVWYVNACQALSLPLMLWTAYGSLQAFSAISGMKLAQRTSSRRALRYGACGAMSVLILEGAAMTMCQIAEYGHPSFHMPALCIAGASCLGAVAWIEYHAPYRTEAGVEAGMHGSPV